MFRAFEVTILTAAGMSAILAGILGSLLKSKVDGVQQWLAGNLLIVLSCPFYYIGWTYRPFLVIEVANVLYGLGAALFVVGYRKHFAKSSLLSPLLVALACQFAALCYFHYVQDLVHVRVVITSLFHILCGGVMVWTLWTLPSLEPNRYLITLARALSVVQVIYLVTRISAQVPYFLGTGLTQADFLNGSNVVLMALGLLLWPALTLAGASLVTMKILAAARDEAKTDFLTRTWTRRALLEFAEREMQRADRTGRPLALLLLDVDDFKNINDSFGHPAGDAVLTELARKVEQSVRSIDYVCRMGGEEFAVLMPETGQGEAIEAAERIREMLGRPRAGTIHFTVSLGVATYTPGLSWQELYEQADQALGRAKREGKNRVVAAGATEARPVTPDAEPHAAN